MTDESKAVTTTALPTPEVVQHVLLGGDLSKLTPPQRVAYYRAVCDSLGLNPLTRPFDYLRLSGKEVLYAKKDAAEQLRQKHKISLGVPRSELVDGMFTVSVVASLPDGRPDSDMGCIDLAGVRGEARANAMMKCVTKAKRRVTLSICGLGVLDETELDTLPDARALNFDPASGALDIGPSEPPPAPAPPKPTRDEHEHITRTQQKKLFAFAREKGWAHDALKSKLLDAFGITTSNDLRQGDFEQALEIVRRGPDPEPAPDDVVPF
jgi:hypothetical protein